MENELKNQDDIKNDEKDDWILCNKCKLKCQTIYDEKQTKYVLFTCNNCNKGK